MAVPAGPSGKLEYAASTRSVASSSKSETVLGGGGGVDEGDGIVE